MAGTDRPAGLVMDPKVSFYTRLGVVGYEIVPNGCQQGLCKVSIVKDNETIENGMIIPASQVSESRPILSRSSIQVGDKRKMEDIKPFKMEADSTKEDKTPTTYITPSSIPMAPITTNKQRLVQ